MKRRACCSRKRAAATADIGVTPSGDFQVSIRIEAMEGDARQSVGRSVSALASVLHRVSIQDQSDAFLVTLSARLPLTTTGRALKMARPPPDAESDGVEAELVEENVRLRRNSDRTAGRTHRDQPRRRRALRRARQPDRAAAAGRGAASYSARQRARLRDLHARYERRRRQLEPRRRARVRLPGR